MVRRIALQDATTLALPGRASREIVSARTGAAASTLRLVEIAPEAPGAQRRGPHVHIGFEECIHVLGGEGITRTDHDVIAVAAGDTLVVPSGERHATYNTGPGVLRLLCFFPVADIRPGTQEFATWTKGGGLGDA